MAFENVFGNVDWRAPERNRAQKQGEFMHMLGMGMQAAQNAADHDLKSRQLEQKKSEVNLKKLAEEGALLAEMGAPIPEANQAAMSAYSKIAPPIFTSDQYGNPIARPSGWHNYSAPAASQTPLDRLGISDARARQGIIPTQATSAPSTPQSPGSYGQATNPAMTTPYDQISPALGMTPRGTDTGFVDDIGVTADAGPAYQLPQTYQAPEKLGARGEIMEEESRQKASEVAMSGALKEAQEIEKEMRKAKRPAFEPKEGFTPSNDDTKLMTKVTVSQRMLDSLINDYTDAVREHGVSVTGSEGALKLDRISGKIRMQVKNLEDLGALQQPDVEAMNAMLGDAVLGLDDAINPMRGVTMAKKGKKIAIDSMDEFSAYVDDTLRNQAEVRGFKLNTPPKRKAQKPTPEQIRAELSRRRGK